MKKVLIIPHTTELSVRKRLREIGLSLSKHYQIYMLHWCEPRKDFFIEKVKATFKDILKKSKIYKKEGVVFAEYPIFHRPHFMQKFYNPYSLERFLIKYKIDVVINGVHYFFNTPRSKKHQYVHIFDINDLPSEDTNSRLGRFVYEFTEHEVKKADAITACSRGLVDYIQKDFNRKAYFIPNGTHLNQFQNIDYEEVRRIRKKYELLNKFVIGYIGHVGDWIDVDFLISFFQALKRKYTNVALMIVGSGAKIDYYKNIIRDKDVVFTGGIPHHKITPYFFAIDAAVLPSKKNLFQDVAFHIKLIEYTAAKKMVISSPLEEVKRLNFPNIFVADLSVTRWLESMDKIRQINWNPEWSKVVAPYDWSNHAQEFCKLIETIKK
jgi:glycosyltransferase involved in cell wall biosynthesis